MRFARGGRGDVFGGGGFLFDGGMVYFATKSV